MVILGVTIRDDLHTIDHVDTLISSCTRSLYALRGLLAKGHHDQTLQVVGIVQGPQQTKKSSRRGAGLSAIFFYCVRNNHMLIGVSLSAICFYCVGKNRMFLL